MWDDSGYCCGRNLDNLVIINTKTQYDNNCALRIWGLVDNICQKLERIETEIANKACEIRGHEWIRRHPRCRYDTSRRTNKTNLV